MSGKQNTCEDCEKRLESDQSNPLRFCRNCSDDRAFRRMASGPTADRPGSDMDRI